jgi:hypothetical protein
MRTAVASLGIFATLGVAALVAAAGPGEGLPAGVPGTKAVGGEGLIALSATAGDQHQQVTVIDPATRAMSVYHVSLATGEVTLKSVRRIHWDLQMNEFNATHPLPGEIRSMIEQ